MIAYVPFVVVLMLQAVVEVGGVGDVEMHTFATLAPDASWTVPVIVMGCFVLVDGDGDAVRSVVGVAVRTGVGVGATVYAGARVRVGVGDPDAGS